MPGYNPELLVSMAEVQARYVLRLARESGRPVEELVETQTPWRGQLPAPGPSWEEFRERACALLTAALPEGERVRALIEYATPLFAASRQVAGDELALFRWFGCFRYHEHPEQDAISLHIRNNCQPNSPFDDLPAAFRSLRELCRDARSLPFPVRRVTCGSWLNDLPIFLSLFPPSYAETLEVSPPDSKSGWGWWGQIVDRTGMLHSRRAARIIETGEFPHPRKSGWCDFAAMEAHVEHHCALDG